MVWTPRPGMLKAIVSPRAESAVKQRLAECARAGVRRARHHEGRQSDPRLQPFDVRPKHGPTRSASAFRSDSGHESLALVRFQKKGGSTSMESRDPSRARVKPRRPRGRGSLRARVLESHRTGIPGVQVAPRLRRLPVCRIREGLPASRQETGWPAAERGDAGNFRRKSKIIPGCPNLHNKPECPLFGRNAPFREKRVSGWASVPIS